MKQITHTYSCILAMLIASLVLVGCSGDPYPSSDDIRAELERICSIDDSLGYIDVIEKTNGQASERGSVPFYSYEYKATIVIVKDCMKKKYDVGYRLRNSSDGTWKWYDAKKGDVLEFDGELKYEKTESGWRLYDPF